MRCDQVARILVCSALALATACSPSLDARKQKYFKSGQKFAEAGKYREASLQFLNAIQLDARYAEAHYQLGKVALQLGDMQTAFFEFQQTAELTPDNLDAQVQYGNLSLARGDVKTARQKADLVLQKQPGNVEARLLMADVLGASGQPAEALTHVQAAIKAAPDRAEPYIGLAHQQLVAGQSEQAENSFKQALKLDSKNLDTLIGLATLYQSQKRWPEAEKTLRDAIAADPKDVQPRIGLVMIFLAQGRNAEAEQVARDAKASIADNANGYRMLGNYYIWANDVPRALAEYAALKTRYARDYQIKKTYTQLLILSDRLDEAEALNTEVLSVVGFDAEALVEKGEILIRRGKPNDAVSPLQQALRSDNENYLAHFYLGMALGMIGDLVGAEREWNDAARLQPNRAEPQLLLANLAARKEDLNLFNRSTARIMQLAPNSAASLVLKASSAIAHRDLPAAEGFFKQAIAAEPKNALPYTGLGELRLVQRNFAEGERLLTQALELEPGNSRALQMLLGLWTSKGENAKALERVNQQIAKAPTNSNYYLMLGVLQYNQKDYPAAEKSFQVALQLSARNNDAWRFLGQSQATRGAVEQTLVTYQKWADAMTGEPLPYVLMGQIYDEKGDWKKAQEFYTKALARDTDNPIAANNLGYSMLEHGGDVNLALSYGLTARKASQNAPAFADTVGWAYYRKGQYQLAAYVLEDAVKRLPTDPSLRFHLGLSYQKLKQWDKAQAELKKALELDSKSPQADEARKALQEVESKSVGGTTAG